MTIVRSLLSLVLVAAVAAACTQTAAGDPPRVAVVVGGRAAGDPAVLAHVRAAVAAARGADVQLRVPRTPTEELAVTHVLAVAGYDAVIAIDLDRRVAVDPVARRFPRLRIVSADAGSLPARLAGAAYR
jgi:predicted TIM-barrel fold metal-dependent hydrolase